MPRALSTLVVPEGLLVLAAAIVVQWPGLAGPLQVAMPYLPAIVLVTATGLAVRFQRADVVLGMLALAGGAAALDAGAAAGALAAILLPVNLAAFALLPDRGLLSAASGRRLIAVGVQAVVVVVLARPDQAAALAPLLGRRLTTAVVPADAAAGDAAALLALSAMAVLTVALLRTRLPIHRGFLWAVAAALLAAAAPPLRTVGGLSASLFLLTAGGISLGVAVIETAHALAYRDALTGLANRRSMDDALRRLHGPFTVAMLDVDHFKQVNDTYGHDVGDQILRMVAAQVAGHCAPGRPFRYGGEEFAILFPGAAAADTRPTLEAVREAVAAAAFTLRAADRPTKKPKQPRRRAGTTTLTVTVSIGVADRRDAAAPPDGIVARADEALYRAKAGGRNRVEGGRRRTRA